MEQWELLGNYRDLIESQVMSNCFHDAVKTFKKVKLFKLDSMNPKEVFDCMSLFTMDNKYDTPLIYKTYHIGLGLCQLKCQVFWGLGDLENCNEWSELSFSYNEKLLDTWGKEKGEDIFLGQYIHTTLTISGCDYSKRRINYDALMCRLFSNPRYVVLLLYDFGNCNLYKL